MVELGKTGTGKRLSLTRERISFQVALVRNSPSPDGVSTPITIAFGIRNVVDRKPAGLEGNVPRSLKSGGRVVIPGLSTPRSNSKYQNQSTTLFSVRGSLPVIGGLFSRFSALQDISPNRLLEFPTQEEFMVNGLGRLPKKRVHYDLTGGIATVYVGDITV